MTGRDTGERPERSFFGRRRGKPLRSAPAAAIAGLLPTYRLDLSAPAPADARGLFHADVSQVRLEIGFGGGEHLLHQVERHPSDGFIGVEPFLNGMAKMAARLAETPRSNLRLHDDDAVEVLDWLPDASLDGIDLLYPDPWPKKKHWKRRFVNSANLDRFARVMKPGALFRFASDIDTYINWTLLHVRRHSSFEWHASSSSDWHTPYAAWPGTRYEAKAIREGRPPAYLTFVRV